MPPLQGNLLAEIPHLCSDEVFETLVDRSGWRMERIVSHGHTTPPGDWYDQDWDEWVLVVQGSARLVLADEPASEIALAPGDWLLLPAHCRHRVTWTTPEEPTVWLALHAPA